MPAQQPVPAQPQAAPEQQARQSGAATDEEYRKFDAVLALIRRRTTEEFAIRSKNGNDEASYVPIGGIEQWLTIRGQDRTNPVLLFVHGGPGDVTSPWTFAAFAPWERYFTVVQWDQRGAGQTLARTGPSVGSTMTLDRMVKDGIEVAEYLRRHLAKQKIVVVAHSFGSLIGLRMIAAHPDLFYAYVGTGQAASFTRNYEFAYEALLKKAQAIGNQEALDDLRRVGPPPYKSGDGFLVQRKWSNHLEGADQFLYGGIGLTLVAPRGSIQVMNDHFDGEEFSAEHLVPQTKGLTERDIGLEFAVPIFFIQGAEDFSSPTELARQYLAQIKAPKKKFVTIQNGGHFAVFTHSNEFLQELVTRVRPLAVER